MISRKAIFAIILAALLLSLGEYTLVSYSDEPHLNLKTTSSAFAVNIATVNVTYYHLTPSTTGTYYTSSPSTLFFRNFSLGGSSASFGFSFSVFFPLTFPPGNGNAFTIYMTRVAQSIAFPYFGTFMLQVFALNVTVTIESNGTIDYNTVNMKPVTGTLVDNRSVAEYYIYFIAKTPFGTNATLVKAFNGVLVPSYNVTYSLEVAPVVEFGPYYLTGTTQWLSHTFQVPFVSG